MCRPTDCRGGREGQNHVGIRSGMGSRSDPPHHPYQLSQMALFPILEIMAKQREIGRLTFLQEGPAFLHGGILNPSQELLFPEHFSDSVPLGCATLDHTTKSNRWGISRKVRARTLFSTIPPQPRPVRNQYSYLSMVQGKCYLLAYVCALHSLGKQEGEGHHSGLPPPINRANGRKFGTDTLVVLWGPPQTSKM